jgi:cyclopropane fatty-acyl-phospholipid synthase-like methyltransferase
MKEMWNNRYAAVEYAYGTEPNGFFKQQLGLIAKTGSILLPAEGEGRNAVYAAQQGWQVNAFDISEQGRKKALMLADAREVSINYQVGTLDETEFAGRQFDAIGLIYAHFPPPALANLHARFANMLKRGGHLILEGFSKSNLPLRLANPAVGGPDKPEMLFTTDELEKQFNGLYTEQLEETEIDLHEGRFHNGVARVVRFVGKK